MTGCRIISKLDCQRRGDQASIFSENGGLLASMKDGSVISHGSSVAMAGLSSVYHRVLTTVRA